MICTLKVRDQSMIDSIDIKLGVIYIEMSPDRSTFICVLCSVTSLPGQDSLDW